MYKLKGMLMDTCTCECGFVNEGEAEFHRREKRNGNLSSM